MSDDPLVRDKRYLCTWHLKFPTSLGLSVFGIIERLKNLSIPKRRKVSMMGRCMKLLIALLVLHGTKIGFSVAGQSNAIMQ